MKHLWLVGLLLMMSCAKDIPVSTIETPPIALTANITVEGCGVFTTIDGAPNICENGGCATCKGKQVHAPTLKTVLDSCGKSYQEACQ